MKIGDTLLLIGFWSDIRDLQSHMEDVVVLNMPVELEEVLPAAQRAPYALAVLGLVVALMVSGLVPNVQAALIGCLLMGLLAYLRKNPAPVRLFGCEPYNYPKYARFDHARSTTIAVSTWALRSATG